MGGEGDFGLWLRKRRLERGLTQRELAELSGLSRRWLVEIEAGRSEPTLTDALALVEALGADLTEVPGAPAPRGARINAHHRVSGAEEGGETKRRQMLGWIATVAGATMLDFEQLAAALEDAGRLDDRLLDDLTVLIRGHAEQWDRLAPRTLVRLLDGHLGNLRSLLAHAPTPGLRCRVQVLASETASLAALFAHTVDNHGDVRAYLDQAGRLAREAHDGPCEAWALVISADLVSVVPKGGQGGDASAAKQLLDAALTRAGSASSPVLRTWIMLRLAEEHAVLGDAAGCRRWQSDADAMFATCRPADEGGVFRLWTLTMVDGFRGGCAQLLGRPDEAAEILEHTLAAIAPSVVSNRAAVLADLGAAYAQQGEVERACGVLADAHRLATAAGLAQRAQRVAGVRHRHLAAWADAAAVRRLDDLLVL